MKQLTVSFGDCLLLIEALQMAAGRHRSMARYSPHNAGPHDRKAEAMQALRVRLIKARDVIDVGSAA